MLKIIGWDMKETFIMTIRKVMENSIWLMDKSLKVSFMMIKLMEKEFLIKEMESL
jgi:hypothetical protein